jgi:hypothetical protein
MAESAIAADIHQPFQVHGNPLSQISFDTALVIDDATSSSLSSTRADADRADQQYLTGKKAKERDGANV